MDNERETKVLNFIKSSGPVLPVKVAKELETSILLASAILTGMINSGKIKHTNQKIGSSQVYYIEGQEEEALKIIHSSLNDFQKKFLSDFKNKKAVFDSDLSPREKIFISELNDFIKPAKVEINGKEEVFWKYYSFSPEEAIKGITKLSGKKQEVEEPKEPTFLKSEKTKKETPKKELLKKETQKDDNILNKAIIFLKEKSFNIIKEDGIRKGREYVLIVEFNNLLKQRYYVKVINKLRINESDISLAGMEGKSKNFPVILLTNGKITSKAEKFCNQKFGEFLKIFKL